MGKRLDLEMVARGIVPTRSQAENYIKLGKVTVDGKVATKPGLSVSEAAQIKLSQDVHYVSRAALKLASVADIFKLNLKEKTVLDVGSSTGGFTDYALRHGAKRVVAVDVGTNQLHQTLRDSLKIELHEQTDIRDFITNEKFDLILIDVSFISLKEVLPSVAKLATKSTSIVAMFKPQFEAGDNAKHKGVIKNDAVRRRLLRQFEEWLKMYFVVLDKADSAVAGAKGNQERFYLLKKA